MSQIISIIGGSGYVGSRITETLLRSFKDIKIYSICRNIELHNLKKYDDRVEIIKGDALKPEKFSSYLEKSTGIIHTIGKLISLDKPEEQGSYKNINYEPVIRVAKICNDFPSLKKKNFVYLSAERGFVFPLSLVFGGYIEYKRKAEIELIKNFQNLNTVILRPGLITDTKERPYLAPISVSFDILNYIEKNLINNVAPNLGQTLELPSASIALDTLSIYAATGAIGKLNDTIYSNDYMKDLNNLKQIDLN